MNAPTYLAARAWPALHAGKQAAAAEVRRPLAQSHGAVQQRVSFLERHRREQEELRAQGANALWPQRAISAENVGYSLLKKAGWREGTGLGAAEQVRAERSAHLATAAGQRLHTDSRGMLNAAWHPATQHALLNVLCRA